jgi:predicted PurR-regulated permease PerM
MIAFVMNIPMVKIEKLFMGKKKSRAKWIRPTSIALTLVIFLAVISAVMLLLVPELINNLKSLAEMLPQLMDEFKTWLLGIADSNPSWKAQITDAVNNMTSSNSVQNLVTNLLNGLISGSRSFLSSVISGVTTTVFAIVFAIYLLSQKEYVSNGLKKLLYAFVPKKYADRTMEIATLTNKTFTNFVSGQCVEAIILSSMFFIVLAIGRFPYALLISVITFVLAFIPMFGATFTAIIGTVLILPVSPIRALIFIAISLVIQQLENNLIYPKVVGKSVGLSGIWTLTAVLIFGSLFGALGMIIGLPVASVAYALLGDTVNNLLKEKRIKRSELKLDEEK